MIAFADFIAPTSVDRFMADQYGRRPAHIPATTGTDHARQPLDWAGFNDLLALASHWTEPNLKLVMNGRPVLPEHYCENLQTSGGPVRRAVPAKVALFTSMGASIVANNVHEISPAIRAMCDMLSAQFMGRAEANVYCSFQNVQAFGSHYDLHEVFAVQCEGEKVWRLYENRAEHPIDPPPFTDDAQAQLERSKGKLMFEVRARPGDVIYIPRGWFHDALATSEASLHVTFSITPPSGRGLFRLLEDAALLDPAFRAYLPDHRLQDGQVLAQHLANLGDRLKTIAASPALLEEVAAVQRGSGRRDFIFDLPTGVTLEWFQATGEPARILREPSGAAIETSRGRTAVPLREPAEWILTRPAFSMQELAARYPQYDDEELRGLVDLLTHADAIAPMNSPSAGR